MSANIIILQDIDNVLFPFKEKQVEYLLEQELISKELAEKIIQSKKPDIITYLLNEVKQRNCIKESTKQLQKKYGEEAKKIKETIKTKKVSLDETDESLEIEALILSTFNDFRNSTHFQTGKINEMISLNKKIKKDNPNLKIIGITARAVHKKKEPALFKEITQKTHDWNINNEVGLDEIFFEKQKINAYHEIINKEEYKNHEVVCFVEDDPRNLAEFLKKGITCVLILYEHHEQEDLIKKLKEEHKEKLRIAHNHEEASKIIQDLI